MVAFDREQIKKLGMDLAAEVHAAHRNGSGSIPLERLVKLAGLPIPAVERRRLAARGDLIFTAADPEGGTFHNLGEAMEIPTEVAKIIVPAEIKGSYRSTPDSLSVEFDPEHTIKGSRMMVSAPLESLSVDPSRAQVRIGGFLGPMLSQDIALV